jgi:predicted Rossmann-fold nucleotide-binding protein
VAPTAGAPGAELESLAELEEHLARTGTLSGCYLQSLDLTGLGTRLLGVPVTQAVFLGCRFDSGVEAALTAAGALVFPALPDLPFDPYRGGLYSPAELYAGLQDGYRHTPDARIWRWWRYIGHHRSLTSELAMTLHDHAVIEALDDLALSGAVGVMGGHRLARDDRGYADAAGLGRALARAGRTVLTGGGPGAMEAVNLGAGLTGTSADLTAAIALLAGTPEFGDRVDEWASAGFETRRRWEFTGASYGVPTWLYGHEPPNVFAAGVAKLFSNALREDVLLRLASGGLVCLPGAAGTVQEVFQAVTPRYYADPGAAVPPLVLVGREHWQRLLPAWPLLQALAEGRALGRAIHLVDSVADVPALLADGVR